VGIEAAHAAGMKCVAVTSTGRTSAEQRSADLIVRTLRELSTGVFENLIAAL
jgi:beta-phosphoglucomutase-like phosphatase (HAD superfamily)